MPTAGALSAFYIGYSDFHAPDRTVIANARQNHRFLKRFGLTRHARLLDYGCGKNLFVMEGRSKLWHGYDPHNDHCDPALLKERFDFITLWGVLEHLANPVGELRRLVQLLHPGGRLALTTVSTETGIPYRHKPPEHVTYWTEAALKRLFRRSGLTVAAYEPYFMRQDVEIYLRCVLNAAQVPARLRQYIHWTGGSTVFVPTNEVIVVGTRPP